MVWLPEFQWLVWCSLNQHPPYISHSKINCLYTLHTTCISIYTYIWPAISVVVSLEYADTSRSISSPARQITLKAQIWVKRQRLYVLIVYKSWYFIRTKCGRREINCNHIQSCCQKTIKYFNHNLLRSKMIFKASSTLISVWADKLTD